MRLIDADKLKQAVLDWQDCYNGFSDTFDKATIIDEIDAQPTVKTEPIKHGKWEHGKELSREFIGGKLVSINYEDFHCSVCGEKYKNKDTIMTFKYCPHCGARNDGEGAET